jgi:cytochrome c553
MGDGDLIVRELTRACVVGFALALSAGAATADAAGRAKAQQLCSVCHGPTGLSSTPDAPNLAGQPEIYLVRQLKDYRSATRRHEVMNVIAKPLTDDDIAALARWFNSIKLEAKAPD